MNLDRALERANSVSTEHQAARLYLDIETELGLGDYTDEQGAAGDQALAILRDRFPNVEDARDTAAEDYIPKTSSSANRHAAGGGSSAGGSARRSSGRRTGARRSTRSSAGGFNAGNVAAGGRAAAERAAGFTGEDVASTVITGLRWLLVGGLAYQILAPGPKKNYPGASAFAGILNGVQKGIGAIVDPVDPFTALGGKPKAQLASAQAASSSSDPFAVGSAIASGALEASLPPLTPSTTPGQAIGQLAPFFPGFGGVLAPGTPLGSLGNRGAGNPFAGSSVGRAVGGYVGHMPTLTVTNPAAKQRLLARPGRG